MSYDIPAQPLPFHFPRRRDTPIRTLGVALSTALLIGACAPAAAPRHDAAAVVAADVMAIETGPFTVASPEPRPPQATPLLDATVSAVASWYGPGMWGNRTACGVELTDTLLGVAHRDLPCGTPISLRYGASTATVPVVDRGPYVHAREFDLTYATKVALGCPDLCRLLWVR